MKKIMDLKPKDKFHWHELIDKRFVAVYIALALVLVINQVVFSVLLADREKAEAFDVIDSGYAQSVTNLGNSTVSAGTNDALLAEFYIPDSSYFNENIVCNGALAGNPCLTAVDSDGAGTPTSGLGDDDGYTYMWQMEPNGDLTRNFFTTADKVCTDDLDSPTEIWIDNDGSFDCDNTIDPGDVIILGTGAPVAPGSQVSDLRWSHSEKVSANGSYDYCDPATAPTCDDNPGDAEAQTETIWVSNIAYDNSLKIHTCATTDLAVDCDGADTHQVGDCQTISYGDPLEALPGTEQLCTNFLDFPTCVYIDPDLTTGLLPANCPGADGDEIYLRGQSCAVNTDVPVADNWSYIDSDSNNSWTAGEDLYYSSDDPNGSPGLIYTDVDNPKTFQGNDFDVWPSNAGFFDADSSGFYDGTDIVLIDNDADGFYSAGDTDAYNEAGGLVGDGATEAITYFNNLGGTGYGPNGYNVLYLDLNSDGLDCHDNIYEDNGNVETGPAGLAKPAGNNKVDNVFENLSAIALKNIGTARANLDVSNVRIYIDPWWGALLGDPSDGRCTGPAGFGDTRYTSMSMDNNIWVSNANGTTHNAFIFFRACIVADIPATAINNRTIQMQIPKLLDHNLNGLYTAGDEGIFLYSINDGPTESAYDFPYTVTISSSNPEPAIGGLPADITPPGDVTDLKIDADAQGKVTMSWVDSVDPDLKEIIIQETSAAKTESIIVNKGIQTATLYNLIIGGTYTFIVKARDINGLESQGISQTIIIPLQGETSESTESIELPIGVTSGELIKDSSSSAVYYIGLDNRKHVFINEMIYKTWYLDFSGVKTVSSATLASVVTGKETRFREGTYLFKKAGDAKVYALLPGGDLSWIKNESIATALYGGAWANKVLEISDIMFSQYTISATDIESAVHPDASLIMYPGSIDVFYLENGSKHYISAQIWSQSRFQDRFISKNIDPVISYPDGPALTAMTQVKYWQ